MTGRFDELGEKMARRYRSEIVDYLTLENDVLYGDVIAVSLENLKALIANLERGEIIGTKELDRFRASGARRVHQSISLESVLHAYRLWGQIVWETIREGVGNDAGEQAEALRIAGRIMEHIDLVSTAVAQAYLDEAQGIWSDREVVRRDLLEALISGKGGSQAVGLQARSLHLELARNYVVLLGRGEPDATKEPTGHPSSPARSPMRVAVDAMKSHLHPRIGFLLVGLRHDEVIALYPMQRPDELETLRRQSLALATDLGPQGFFLGVGSWHPRAEGVATSYSEAKDAAEIAVETAALGRPVQFDDVVLDHALRSNPKSERLLSTTLEPLREYDRRHGTELIPTLQAYLQAGFNMTKAASTLCVHPNTVVYRLTRVKALTGRDPHDFGDLLLLCLSVKVGGLASS